MPVGLADPKTWIYKEIACIYLPEEVQKAPIPDNYTVTGEWNLVDNFHFLAVLISPKNV